MISSHNFKRNILIKIMKKKRGEWETGPGRAGSIVHGVWRRQANKLARREKKNECWQTEAKVNWLSHDSFFFFSYDVMYSQCIPIDARWVLETSTLSTHNLNLKLCIYWPRLYFSLTEGPDGAARYQWE